MADSNSTQSFIDSRTARLLSDWNSHDVPKFMTWFSPSATFTNHGSGALDWSAAQQAAFLEDVLKSTFKTDHKTVGTYGDKAFTSWEWTAKFEILKETEMVPAPVGTVLDFIGVTMLWWDMRERGDGKVVKSVEYNKILT